MFDIGFSEMLLCAVIALLVLGPERLPGAARAAGRWVGKARRLVQQMSQEFDRQMQAEELREKIRQEGEGLGLQDVQKSVREALGEVREFNPVILPPDAEARPQTPSDSPAPRAEEPEEEARERADSEETVAATGATKR